MLLQILITLLLGTPLFIGGQKLGKGLVRRGVTAKDLFKGNEVFGVLFLLVYIGLLMFAVTLPQMPALPVEWRFYGMRVSWTLLRVMLMAVCGIGLTIALHTAKKDAIAVILIGLIGLGGLSSTEAYFLEPIYPELFNNLQANGIFRQTSNSSCAPAALATILRLWGIDATESSVARLAQTSRLGTSMAQLIIAAKGYDMDGIELKPTWEQMQKINRPGVLAVWLLDRGKKLPHAVALLGLNSEFAIIGDPSRGMIFELDRQSFAEVWREEYVPIFRKGDRALATQETIDYLKKLGYVKASENGDDLKSAIGQFQEANNMKPTGNLDAQTVLLLTGSFLQNVPTLNPPNSPLRYQL
jgi:predicted double-glycine peptidase